MFAPSPSARPQQDSIAPFDKQFSLALRWVEILRLGKSFFCLRNVKSFVENNLRIRTMRSSSRKRKKINYADPADDTGLKKAGWRNLIKFVLCCRAGSSCCTRSSACEEEKKARWRNSQKEELHRDR